MENIQPRKKREDNMNSQIHFLNEAKRLAPKREDTKTKSSPSGKGNIFWKEKN